MATRREFLIGCGALIMGNWSNEDPLIASTDLDFLRGLATDTIASATKVASNAGLGFQAVTPGGDYPSLWVRDFSMAAGCGLIPNDTIREHLFTIAKAQNGPQERKLGKGRAIIPPNAIPDHINFAGGSVFYPGTYSSGDDQGGEPYGVLPPVDDHYEFIHIAHVLWRRSTRRDFLNERVGDHTLRERLLAALECPATDPRTGLVTTEVSHRAVGFGFCDSVYFTGSLLFASLLRRRALIEMTDLNNLSRQSEILKIEASIPKTFLKNGWLIAATGVGRQPDVWGSIYAVYSNAVTGDVRQALLKYIADAVRRGTITNQGAVRHVPTDHDFSPTSAWEKTAGVPVNIYQNGAYWHVPTGWLARVLWEVDKPLARRVVKEMVTHFREDDFRKGGGHGAPWECFHGTYRQNPVYMASVTLPLEALAERR